MSEQERWNERYSKPDYHFGTAPNAFLESQRHLLKPGMKALAETSKVETLDIRNTPVTEAGLQAFAGKGLAKVLASGALDDVVGSGKVIVPVCPFIASFVRKNTQYDDHVKWPG